MKTFAKFEATKSSIDRKLDAISQSSKKSQQSSLKKILTAVKSSGKNFRKRVTRYQFSFSCPNFFFYRSSGRTILWKLHVQFILLKGVHLFMTFFLWDKSTMPCMSPAIEEKSCRSCNILHLSLCYGFHLIV